MKKAFVTAVLTFLIIATPAFAALNITVSVDKTTVFMGDTVTITGKIAFINSTTTTFTYRAAVVAPKGILVCDTNKTTTGPDGSFSLTCKLPTTDQAAALGIPAATRRSVIPYVGGVAVQDPTTNQTVKKHLDKAILAVNPSKFSNELNGLINQINQFINQSQKLGQECDKVAEKAAKRNITDVASKCLRIQIKINKTIANAAAISAKAQQLKTNVNLTSVEDFKNDLKSLRDATQDFKNDLKDIRNSINSIKWDTTKEIKNSTDEIRRDLEKQRQQIRHEKEGNLNMTGGSR